MSRKAIGGGFVFVGALLLPSLGLAKPNPQNGPKLFRRVGCRGCHLPWGTGDRAPELFDVGKRMDFAAIKKQIENPRARNRNSAMPSARDLGVRPREVEDLAAWLAG